MCRGKKTVRGSEMGEGERRRAQGRRGGERVESVGAAAAAAAAEGSRHGRIGEAVEHVEWRELVLSRPVDGLCLHLDGLG